MNDPGKICKWSSKKYIILQKIIYPAKNINCSQKTEVLHKKVIQQQKNWKSNFIWSMMRKVQFLTEVPVFLSQGRSGRKKLNIWILHPSDLFSRKRVESGSLRIRWSISPTLQTVLVMAGCETNFTLWMQDIKSVL